MNILILTGKFGMGHIKCAEAIAEEIHCFEPKTNIYTVDLMDSIFPHLSGAIYKGFSLLVTKLPGMYNFFNHAAGHYSGVPMKKAIAKKIECLMKDCNPDIVISNLPICSKFFSAYKDFHHCTQPLYTYITDITVHDEWIAENTDLYFVGDLSTKQSLISKGVSAEKIVITGIPVKQDFKAKISSNEVKKNVLIMGGGLGLIPGEKQFLRSINNMQELNITLIAGTNRRLEKRARKKYANINVIGFTNHVSRYMQDADLIITKPGGITTFEAIATETPLYVIDPYLEQELGNAYFIESNNIGHVVRSRDTNIAEDLAVFMENTGLLESMKKNMKQISKSFACSNPVNYYSGSEV